MAADYSNFSHAGKVTERPFGLEQPPRYHLAVTPDDNVALPPGCRALYIGTAPSGQTVAVKDQDPSGDSAVTYPVTSFQVFPGQWTYVMSTGTTATNIVAWY